MDLETSRSFRLSSHPPRVSPPVLREKKLLVSSEDYGRDLTGVQNLRKKHKRLEAELGAHEPAIQVRTWQKLCVRLCVSLGRLLPW